MLDGQFSIDRGQPRLIVCGCGTWLNDFPIKIDIYRETMWLNISTGWGPPVISWFINPMNTIVI